MHQFGGDARAAILRVSAETDRGEVLLRRPLACGEERDETQVLAALRPIEHRVTVEAMRLWCFMRERIRVV